MAPGFADAHADVFAHLDEVCAVGWGRVAYGSRLVVDVAARGHSRLAVALMVGIYAWNLRNGAALCLCHTVEPLLPLMEKMGWQRRGVPLLALTLIRNPSDGSPRILPVTKSLIAERSVRSV